MKISKNCIVKFHYELFNESNEEIENSRIGDALAYLHGGNNIFPKLEAEMEGKNLGECFSVTLKPEDAYGARLANSEQRISRKHISNKGKIRPGMVINVNTGQGQRQVVAIKVGKFIVDVDTNHPMAGKTLTFKIEIMDVREASAEELSHGHAHGAGGHQH